MGADPDWFIEKKLAKTKQGLSFFDEGALAEYKRCFRNPGDHPRHLRGLSRSSRRRSGHGRRGLCRRPQNRMPCAVCCGVRPVAWAATSKPGPAEIWRNYATNIVGAKAVPSGHYLSEEAPAETTAALREFFLPLADQAVGEGAARKFFSRIPEQMPVFAPASAVRGLRQDDKLAVAVRKLPVEVEQVVIGRVAVEFAAQHQDR